MEPIVSKEGFELMQDFQRSREAVNSFYTRMGYKVVEPRPKTIKVASKGDNDNKSADKRK